MWLSPQDAVRVRGIWCRDGTGDTDSMRTNVEVMSLSPNLLQDIWADIRLLGRATDRLQEAGAVLATCFECVNDIIAGTLMIPAPPE
jgi:hypothetical protein